MSVNFYAGKMDDENCFGPVIPFSAHDQFEWVENPETGEADKLANPAYVEHADLHLSNSNADHLASLLGLPEILDGTVRWDIGAVTTACIRWLTGAQGQMSPAVADVTDAAPGRATMIHCGRREGYDNEKVVALLMLATTGRGLGATHVVGC